MVVCVLEVSAYAVKCASEEGIRHPGRKVEERIEEQRGQGAIVVREVPKPSVRIQFFNGWPNLNVDEVFGLQPGSIKGLLCVLIHR
jgi:hypothetical protein